MGSSSSIPASLASSTTLVLPHEMMENIKIAQMEDDSKIVMEGVIRESGKEMLHEKSDRKETNHRMTDEVKLKKDNIFRLLNNAIEKIQDLQSLREAEMKWNENFLSTLQVISNVFHDIQEIDTLSYEVVLKYRLEAGQRLLETKTLTVMCNVIIDVWRVGFKDEEGNIVDRHFEVLRLTLSSLLNYSDSNPDVINYLVAEKDFLETLKNILISYLPENIPEKKKMYKRRYLVNVTLSLFYNISQVDITVPRLRSLDIVTTVVSYLTSKANDDRLTALALLANIIDEKESEVLQDKQDSLTFLMNILGSALKKKSHDYKGWSACECAMTVRRLARNDANKKILVEMGCLPHLVELAKSGTIQEQREAVGAIWVLAFDKDNQKKIIENNDLKIAEFLIDLREKSKDREVKKAADGTLWSLRQELQGDEKFKQLDVSWKERSTTGKSSTGTEQPDKNDINGHIMISYNWSHQKELMKIRDLLQKDGYDVWMDIDNMAGSTLQTMAEAVELAHVVIICMSQKYKDSPNCRAEAEYAFQLRKKIIPLKMEKEYKPDGWLGLIAGAKVFYEFSGKYPFDAKFKDLLKELAACYGSAKSEPKNMSIISQIAEDKVDAIPVSIAPMVVTRPNHKITLAVLRKWTSQDVDQWLQQHSLPREQFGLLTGRDIASLVKMKTQAPEFFYYYVYRELKINSLSIMDILTEALEGLAV